MSLAMALYCSCGHVSEAVCFTEHTMPSPVSGHGCDSLRPGVGVCGG